MLLSFGCALQRGGTGHCASMARFGRYVGLSFQIADDILDIIGDERSVGKSLGTDLEQQKMTLPLIRMLSHSPATLAARVRQILNAPGHHRREALKPCLAECDALDYTRRRVRNLPRKRDANSTVCRNLLAGPFSKR